MLEMTDFSEMTDLSELMEFEQTLASALML